MDELILGVVMILIGSHFELYRRLGLLRMQVDILYNMIANRLYVQENNGGNRYEHNHK